MSGGVGLLKRDQAAGELEQGEVVGRFLRPADQQRPVAVEPRVAGLDDPAARAPAGSGDLLADLVVTTADVRDQVIVVGELDDPRVVVAAVEAKPLRPLRRRGWTLDRDRVEGRR